MAQHRTMYFIGGLIGICVVGFTTAVIVDSIRDRNNQRNVPNI